MKQLVRCLLAAAAMSLAAVSHAEDAPAKTAKIDQAALLKRIDNKDSSMVILDVRTPEEYAKGHVPGAINIPYTHLPARISEIADAADKDIVLYCATGVRAERGAERLRENGFSRLLHLDGDMKVWEEKQRPLVK
jgi:rhodanese-related sulfurtransferase